MTNNKNVTVGIISAPDHATKLAENTLHQLEKLLREKIDSNISWHIVQVIDPLTGAAEAAQEILYSAASIKYKKEWDYAICLTDLPIFFEKDVVVADLSFRYDVAQISVPTFGFLAMKKRVKKAIIQLLYELYEQDKYKDIEENQLNEQNKEQVETTSTLLKRIFPFLPMKRQINPDIYFKSELDFVKEEFHIQETNDSTEKINSRLENEDDQRTHSYDINDNNIDVRYLMYPRINGKFKLILGMTIANNPLRIMASFKRVTTVAFTTGAFGLIFPTIWKLGQLFSIYRLTGMMCAAMIGLVAWLIIAHNLWEHTSMRNEPNLRRLYNMVTVTTLVVDVLTYYIILYILFSVTIMLIIPVDYFQSEINDVNGSGSAFFQYLRAAWATTSISTIVSAIGVGLEDEELVKDITYGYRQKRRYKETEQYKNNNEPSL